MTIRTVFLQELDKLNQNVIKMGALLEDSIALMIKALKEINVEVAKEVIEKDDQLDHMERKIEQACLELIAKQQPVASDLRAVTAIQKIVTDIERIGDHCEDISEYVIQLADKERIDAPSNLIDMVDVVRDMAARVITCFVENDAEEAKRVVQMDDTVDKYFKSIREELSLKMQKNKDLVPQCIDYLMIIKYLERMGDHVENIGEWIDFTVTGKFA